LQADIAQQLQVSSAIYGPGSGAFRTLQEQALALLQPILSTAAADQETALQLQQQETDGIDAINKHLADQLSVYGAQVWPLLTAQRDAFKSELAKYLPAGTDLEAILSDPMAAQTLVANLQLDQLQQLNTTLAHLDAAVEGRAKTGTQTAVGPAAGVTLPA